MYILNIKSPGHQEVCFYTVKYCKIAIFCTFLSLTATEINTMTWNYIWTNQRGWKTYMPNFKFLGHQEVCFYTVKYCKIVIFCKFFWAWLLQKLRHWHEFLQGQTSGGKKRTFWISSVPDIRKFVFILQNTAKLQFFVPFWAWLPQKSIQWHEIIHGQTNGDENPTCQISSFPVIGKYVFIL